MRRKIEELKSTLSGFVDQREHLLLVVSSSDTEMVYVLKTLQGLDEAAASDLFLLFGEPFTDPAGYTSAVIKSLHTQLDSVQADRAARGQAPLPPIPAACDDASAAPLRRMRAAIEYVSSQMPAEGEHRLVWGLLPLRIDDREGYAQLVGHFLLWEGPQPWMKGLRVIARDDRESPFLFPALRKVKAPGALLYEPDMSPAALIDALATDAADRSLPVPERMQALAQLAGLDYAHQRYPQAIEKYKLLYDYYAEHKAPAMQAVALQGVGDVLRRSGKPRDAKDMYQQALTLASEARALPVLLNLTFAVGDISLELGDHADADGFFALSQGLAGKLSNPFAQGDALEKQGIARDVAGDLLGAILVWREASALCQTFAYHERRRSVLERLIHAYKAAAMDAERQVCEAELGAVLQAMKEEAP